MFEETIACCPAHAVFANDLELRRPEGCETVYMEDTLHILAFSKPVESQFHVDAATPDVMTIACRIEGSCELGIVVEVLLREDDVKLLI